MVPHHRRGHPQYIRVTMKVPVVHVALAVLSCLVCCTVPLEKSLLLLAFSLACAIALPRIANHLHIRRWTKSHNRRSHTDTFFDAHEGGEYAGASVVVQEITEKTPANAIVRLNVGGVRFSTTLGTLRKYPDSFLGAMFSSRHRLECDARGDVFIDRDPVLLGVILQFLRQGNACAGILS